MFKLHPAVLAVAGAAATAIVGIALWSTQNPEPSVLPPPDEQNEVALPCNGMDPILFEDAALQQAVQEAISGNDEDTPVSCEKIQNLKRLEAANRSIFSLSGLEHATALEYLNLANNTLVNIEALGALQKLKYLNLSNANIPFENFVLQASPLTELTELYIDGNALENIFWIEAYDQLEILALQNNRIKDLTPLLQIKSFETVGTVFLYNNPLDLSSSSDQPQVIDILKEQGVDVIWDELSLQFGVETIEKKETSVEAPKSVTLRAQTSINSDPENIEIASVEFFERLGDGSLTSLGLDATAPYSYTVNFSQNDIGTHHFAAKAMTKAEAFVQTGESEQVTVHVKKKEPEPECRVNADCSDAKQCTKDTCVNQKCTFTPIAACEATELSCSDGKDNDQDGNPDCDDTDCFENPSCKSEPAPTEPMACLDLSVACNAVSGDTTCTLRMNNSQCGVGIVACDSESCWIPGTGKRPFDFQGCGSLRTKLQTLPAGTRLSGAAAIGLDSSQQCAGLNLCNRIILCAQ